MEFLKQIWRNSPACRILFCLAVVGSALALATAHRGPPPGDAARQMPSDSSLLGRIQKRLPGSGGLGETGQTAAKAVDVVDKAVETTGRAIDIADHVVQTTSDALDSVLGTKGQPAPKPPR